MREEGKKRNLSQDSATAHVTRGDLGEVEGLAIGEVLAQHWLPSLVGLARLHVFLDKDPSSQGRLRLTQSALPCREKNFCVTPAGLAFGGCR